MITKPAFHGWIPAVVDQPPPSMQCLSAALPEVLCSFFIYGVNLARAEVLSWRNQAVKSLLMPAKSRFGGTMWRLFLTARQPWAPLSLSTTLASSARQKGVSCTSNPVALRKTVGIQHRWILGDVSGHPDFTQQALVTHLTPKPHFGGLTTRTHF